MLQNVQDCMEWNITPKASPCLAFTLSNHTSHSVKQGHPQHTTKPHFHPVSVTILLALAWITLKPNSKIVYKIWILG